MKKVRISEYGYFIACVAEEDTLKQRKWFLLGYFIEQLRVTIAEVTLLILSKADSTPG